MSWNAGAKIFDTLRLSGYVFNDELFQAPTKIVFFNHNVNDLCTFKGFDDQVRQCKGILFDLQIQTFTKKTKISEIK